MRWLPVSVSLSPVAAVGIWMGLWAGLSPSEHRQELSVKVPEPCFAPPSVSIEPIVTPGQRRRFAAMRSRAVPPKRVELYEASLARPAELIDGDPAMYGPPD